MLSGATAPPPFRSPVPLHNVQSISPTDFFVNHRLAPYIASDCILTVRLRNGGQAWATSGTPTDCVTLGLDVVMAGRCDLVVSGINAGPNLGWDLTYSGTVAAAFEGAVLNFPSIAISVASEGIIPDE